MWMHACMHACMQKLSFDWCYMICCCLNCRCRLLFSSIFLFIFVYVLQSVALYFFFCSGLFGVYVQTQYNWKPESGPFYLQQGEQQQSMSSSLSPPSLSVHTPRETSKEIKTQRQRQRRGCC